MVRTLTGPGDAGAIHRVNWDLRHNVLTATGLTMPTVAAEGAGGRGGRAAVAAVVVEAAVAVGEVTKGVWRVVEVIRIPMPFHEAWGRAERSFPRALTR